MIGADMVSKASPDRYSLLLSSIGPMAINASLYKMPYDIVNDFAPVTYTGNVANLLVLRPTLPAMAERLSAADVRSKLTRRKSGVIS
jgi:tripartite-type tricarboxylate transporter receptor subunit TctC